MTDLASPAAGPLADVDETTLSDQLIQLVRVMHVLKAQMTSGTGQGPEARERAAHVLLFPPTPPGPLRPGAPAELALARQGRPGAGGGPRPLDGKPPRDAAGRPRGGPPGRGRAGRPGQPAGRHP